MMKMSMKVFDHAVFCYDGTWWVYFTDGSRSTMNELEKQLYVLWKKVA